MSLLAKIIDYEEGVHQKYLVQRKLFVEHLQTLKTDEYSNEKLNTIISDLKCIIDPIKNSINAIDFFIDNKKENFASSDSVTELEDIQKLLFTIIT
jgi:hypothetical protein